MDISRRRRPILRAGLLAAAVLALLATCTSGDAVGREAFGATRGMVLTLDHVAASARTRVAALPQGRPPRAQPEEGSAPALAGYELVAHRGSTTAQITENTLPAFERATTLGADAIELDVRLTADRELVVMHDTTLHRTTTCTELVRERTLRWIKRHCLGERGGESIPSLATALSWAAARDVRLLLDIKMPPRAWRAEDYARLTSLVRTRGVGARARYLSFLPRHLLGVRAADRSARIHAIARTLEEVEDYRAWADAIHLAAPAITPELLASLRDDGIAVLGRNTNGPDDWDRLRRLGVDGVLTDQMVEYDGWLPAGG